MADIFVSWGSPDEKTINRLLERLDSLGLSFYNYRRDMPGGGEIPKQVINEIHQAKVALLCMSNDSVGREWLQRELHWCYSDYISDIYPLQRLIPVIVGNFSTGKFPLLLAEANLHRFDISKFDSLEDGLEKLLSDIQIGLGEPPPRVIPATVLAMNCEVAKCILFEAELPPTWRELCRTIGMLADERWAENCLSRYGLTAEEFRPFSPNEHIVSIVLRAAALLNQVRQGSPPIAIHWYSASLLTGHGPESELARRHWQHDSQLLIVDALSVLDEQVRTDLTGVLALSAPSKTRRAVLWMPPYTHYTKDVQELIRQTAGSVVQLEAPFRDWSVRPERNLSFDIGMPATLTRWLNQALTDLASSPPPIASNLSELTQRYQPAGPGPSYWYRVPNRAGL